MSYDRKNKILEFDAKTDINEPKIISFELRGDDIPEKKEAWIASPEKTFEKVQITFNFGDQVIKIPEIKKDSKLPSKYLLHFKAMEVNQLL